jgi:hypothetical protein
MHYLSRVGPLRLGEEAVKQDLLSDTDYRAYEYLRHTRNKVLHAASDSLTAAQAVELASLAESLVDTALVRAVVRKQRQMEKNLGYPLGSDGETSSET